MLTRFFLSIFRSLFVQHFISYVSFISLRSLLSDVSKVQPYFSEKIVATTENVHLVICVHGLDGKTYLFDDCKG